MKTINMNIIKSAVFLMLTVWSFNAHAQQYDLYGIWTRKAGVSAANSGVTVSQMITDSQGNMYVCGSYYGSVSLSDNTCVLNNSGGHPYNGHLNYGGYIDPYDRVHDGTEEKRDGFVSKYDSKGNWVWSVTIQTNVMDLVTGMALSPDEASLVFLGRYGNSLFSDISVTGPTTVTYGTGATESLTFNTAPDASLDCFCLVKVNTGDGAKIFHNYLGRGYNDTADGGYLRLSGIVHNTDGYIYLYGNRRNSSAYWLYIDKYDFNGVLQASPGYSLAANGVNAINSGFSKNQSISNIYHVGGYTVYGSTNNEEYNHLYKFSTANSSITRLSHISSYSNANRNTFTQNYRRYGIIEASSDVNSDDTHLFLAGNTVMSFTYVATGVPITNPDSTKYDGIIVCYNPQLATGNIRWTVNLSATGNQRISGCKFDETTQTLKVVGSIDETVVNFNPRGTAMDYSASSGTAAFYAVYDMDGICQKVEIMDAAGDEAAQALDLSGSKEVSIFGTFTGSPFQADPSGRLDPMRTTQSSAFLTKYSTNPLSVPDSKAPGSYSALNNIKSSYGQAYHSIMQCLSLGALNSPTDNSSFFYTPQEIQSVATANPNYDGLVSILPDTPAGGYTVNVRAKNDKSSQAHLIAWIDFDGNGVFDSHEASAVVTVPANTATLTQYALVWTNLPVITRAHLDTYLRIRLTSETVDGTWAAGDAADGETEEYALTLDLLDITKTAVSNNKYNSAHAAIGDTITYTLNVENKIDGDVVVFDPIPAGTAYVDNSAVPAGTLTSVNLYGQSVSAVSWNLGSKTAGSQTTLSFRVALTDYPPDADSVFNIAFAVMNGDTIPSTGSSCDMAIITVDGPRANNDTVSTLRNTPLTVDVLANDDYPAALCTPELTIIEDSYNGIGSATVSSGKIIYTPDDGKFGIDSILYQLKCPDNRISTAKVYVMVSNPLLLQYVACQGASVTMGFNAITGVTYRWYQPNGTTVVSSSANSITVTKGSNVDYGYWWVEPRWGNFVFPRHRVDLELGDCGVTDPQNCAKDGTVIFKEDFGGNNPGDPLDADLPLDITTYTYNPSGMANSSTYCLTKQSKSHYMGTWYNLDDHTYPNNTDKGYLLQVNAGSEKGQFYEYTIEHLCEETKLYFSAWIASVNDHEGTHKTNIIFVLENTSGVELARYYTGNVPDADPAWKQYGFQFTVPGAQSSIVLKIINNGAGTSGNDFVMDDIEIRLCAPPVTTNIEGNDTIVCAGNNLDIIGSYTEDCTFGDELSYRWEFRHKDSVSWKTLNFGDVTVDCDSGDAADRTIRDTVKITSATKASEGYYRMLVSSPANIGSVNCRAASDSIYVHVVDTFVAPDIRIQVCPSPPLRTIQLSSFLDSTDYDRIVWSQVSPYPSVNSATGEIKNATFQKGTYTYKYTLLSPEYSGCGSTSAKVYLRTLSDRILGKTGDTITICSALELSRFVNLNQIFGLALEGNWSYPNDPDNITSNNVKISAAPPYAGAHVFNAQKAYSEADGSYDYIYHGAAVKKFEFVYAASCISGSKRVVLIVTP